MRRPALWLWCSAAFLGLMVAGAIGGWLAIRWWPETVGPRLPPRLALAIAGFGKMELEAARHAFSCESSYRHDHPFTPAQIAERDALLCRWLKGDREEQLAALAFMLPGKYGFIPASSERNALIFALTSLADAELRRAARDFWQDDGQSLHSSLRRIQLDAFAGDTSSLSPDRWQGGPAAAIAWRINIFLDARYDHRNPNRYQKTIRALLDQLLALETGRGRFATDDRDHLLALQAMADLLAVTKDEALKPVVERGAAAIDRARLERLWLEDTTVACTSTLCAMALRGAGIPCEDLYRSLESGFAAWLATRPAGSPPRWYAQGAAIAATEGECWGAALTGQSCFSSQHPGAIRPATPAWLADAAISTPFGRYLMRIGAARILDPGWRTPFAQRTLALLDTQIITPDHLGLEGTWPARGDNSAAWETLFAILELGQMWYEPYRGPP